MVDLPADQVHREKTSHIRPGSKTVVTLQANATCATSTDPPKPRLSRLSVTLAQTRHLSACVDSGVKADPYYKSREPPSEKTAVEATCGRSKTCSSPRRLATVPVTGVEGYGKPKRRKFGVEKHSDEGRLESNEPGMTLASPILALSRKPERYDVERAAAGVVKGFLAIVSFSTSKGHMNSPKEPPSNFEVEEYGEDRCRPKRKEIMIYKNGLKLLVRRIRLRRRCRCRVAV